MTTKVPVELSSTPGIVDNSNATAITIDSSENAAFAGNLSIASGAIAVGQSTFSGGSVVADFHTSGSGVGTQLAFANDHNTDKFYVGLEGNTTGDAFLYQQEDADINFYTNNTFRAKLDNSGHLSVGATSITNGGGYNKVIQVSGSEGCFSAISSSGEGLFAQNGANTQVINRCDGYMQFRTNNVERFRIENTGNQSQYAGQSLANNFYLDSGSSQGAFNFSWFTDGASALQSVAHMYVQQGSGDGAARKAEIIFQVADNNAPNTVLSLFNNKNATLVGTLSQGGSDERIKNNITPIANATDKLKTLRGVEFDWNTEVCPFEGHEVGLIAQEVEKVIPSAVKLAPFDTSDKDKTSISGQDYKTIQYDKIIPLLVETIKELEARIKTLEDA